MVGMTVKSREVGALGVVTLISAVAVMHAVQPPATPAFEVASVKPAPRDVLLTQGLLCGFSGGRFRALGTLQWLISCAYGIPAARAGQEISGGPKWLDDDLFAIAATSPPDRIPHLRTEGLVMLQTL